MEHFTIHESHQLGLPPTRLAASFARLVYIPAHRFALLLFWNASAFLPMLVLGLGLPRLSCPCGYWALVRGCFERRLPRPLQALRLLAAHRPPLLRQRGRLLLRHRDLHLLLRLRSVLSSLCVQSQEECLVGTSRQPWKSASRQLWKSVEVEDGRNLLKFLWTRCFGSSIRMHKYRRTKSIKIIRSSLAFLSEHDKYPWDIRSSRF